MKELNKYSLDFQINISSKAFGDPFSCLGSQLLKILNAIDDYVDGCDWYASDVQVNGSEHLHYLESYRLKKIGSTLELKNIASNTDQLLSGVFLGVRGEMLKCAQIELGTEDDEFRPIHADGTVIEIRAFDTSFYEIYTANNAILDTLQKSFPLAVVSIKQQVEI